MELLVVMLIIVVLVGIGAMNVSKNNTAAGMDTALSTMESLINQAKNTAISKNTSVRLAINNDATDENYRKEIIIAEDTSDTDTPNYEAQSKAIRLPADVFIDTSGTLSVDGLMVGALDVGSEPISVGSNTFPSYVAIQFNSKGICKFPGNSSNIEPGAQIILFNHPIANPAQPVEKEAAVVVWRTGATTLVKDPGQIN